MSVNQKNQVNALILTFAKTDVKWWHDFVEDTAEVHFIKGRIRFNDKDGKPAMFYDKRKQKYVKGCAPYGSCWIIFRAGSQKNTDRENSLMDYERGFKN